MNKQDYLDKKTPDSEYEFQGVGSIPDDMQEWLDAQSKDDINHQIDQESNIEELVF